MAQISLTLPTIGQPVSTEDQDVINAFTTIQSLLNGNIDTANLSASAALVDTQLASPNNAVWRTIYSLEFGALNSAIVTGANSYLAGAGGAMVANSGQSTLHTAFPFDPADYAVVGKSLKLRTKLALLCNGTAPGTALTAQLHPISSIGGAAGALTMTVATAVTSSGVSITGSASSAAQGASSSYDAPTAQPLVLALSSAGAMSANAVVAGCMLLQFRNV